MSAITENELIDIGRRMAKDLQSYINVAIESGCGDNPLPHTKALVDEWEEIYSRTSNLMDDIRKNGADSGIAALNSDNSLL